MGCASSKGSAMSRPSTKVISVEQQQQQQVSTGSAKPTIANTALAAGFAIRWQNAALSAQLQQEKAHNERLRMEVAMQEELQQTHFSMVDVAIAQTIVSRAKRGGANRKSSVAKTVGEVVLLGKWKTAALAGKKGTGHVSLTTRQVFGALDLDGSGKVSSQYFAEFIDRSGLRRDDCRLTEVFKALEELGGIDADVKLTLEQFNDLTSSCNTLMYKCFTGDLRVPNFGQICDVIERVYESVLPNTGGAVASYIPSLAKVKPDQLAISVTTVDGQHFSIGDTEAQFCIQSCSKPVSYLLALKQFGVHYVHQHVGTEPSGRKFNEMILKDVRPCLENQFATQIPHNPCINAGAIMSMSMVYPGETRTKRLERVLDVWKQVSQYSTAPPPIGFDEETYRSESETADRNWALAYMMKESNAFPPCFTNLSETLELYFQVCSILSTCKCMSVMAATLANGGLNPYTAKKAFLADHVRSALPIMLMAGMYDYSGQWAYDIGVPAKSGVAGCVYVVIPNVCGISFWSPRLDDNGNSVRGVAAATELVKYISFHNFEVFSGLSHAKIDPTIRKNENKQAALSDLLFAASEGDVAALILQAVSGVDVFASDYDSRTPLHLAAAEGHVDAVRFLVNTAMARRAGEAGALSTSRSCLSSDQVTEMISMRDRWGGTPLSDAVQSGSVECRELLEAAGAMAGQVHEVHTSVKTRRRFSLPENQMTMSTDAPQILYAAAEDDLDELVKIRAAGGDIGVCDYDKRTALHLAASNGHDRTLRYILTQAAKQHGQYYLGAVDRWGNTARDDAAREAHPECVAIIDAFASNTPSTQAADATLDPALL